MLWEATHQLTLWSWRSLNRQLQQSHQLLKTSATLSDRNSIYDSFFSVRFLPSSLLALTWIFFSFCILIYITRYCLSRSCAVRENKMRTVKNLIFPKADSCWRRSIGGKVFEVFSVTLHIKSSFHHASSSRNKAETKLLCRLSSSSCFSLVLFTSGIKMHFDFISDQKERILKSGWNWL